MRLAIFDIDGVIVSESTERAFWRYLAKHGRQGPRQLVAFGLCYALYLPFAGIHAGRTNKAYLAGLERSDIDALARSFMTEWLDGHLCSAAVTRLKEHQQRGDTVVLLSGTLEALARPLAERLGVDHVVATLPLHRNGRYTPSLPAIHPFAASKLALAQRFVTGLEVDWQDVSAYGDSYYDIALLEAVGSPVAVQPDTRLRKVAAARGWEIFGEGQPVEPDTRAGRSFGEA
jgi:HAD superfamily hydrolase (TIGR01490 family)